MGNTVKLWGKVLVTQSCPTLCHPMGCSVLGSSVHEDSPGKSTGVGSHSLLQGISLTQGSNPGLPHCRRILYHLSPQGPVSSILTSQDSRFLPAWCRPFLALHQAASWSHHRAPLGTMVGPGLSDAHCFVPSILLFSTFRRESKSSSCYSVWAKGRSWVGQGAKKGDPKYFQNCQLLLNKTKSGPFLTSLWINKRLNMQENYVLCDMICHMKENF